MNYKESKIILDEINKVERILINCHRKPDPDSIGCALALYRVLKKKSKKVKIICPSSLKTSADFLPDYGKIERVDFSKFDFSDFDLFITLDSSNWDIVGNLDTEKLDIKTIVIDHHNTNAKYGDINCVDINKTSTGEMLYLIFKDWKVELDMEMATCLLTGIVGDTGAFSYPGSAQGTLEIAGKLMNKGADKDEIIHHLYRSVDIKMINFWGEVLSRVKIDKKGNFVWSAIPYDKFLELGKLAYAKSSVASLFAPIVKGTDFGMIMVEEEDKFLAVSFRSRSGFDTSKIAQALGGGGHIYTSGSSVRGLSFKKAVAKVLETSRRIYNEDKK